VETAAVKGALNELKVIEDSARGKVLETYALKEAIGSTRPKGSEVVKERLGILKGGTPENQSVLKPVSDKSGVWAELAKEEESALSKVKKLVEDRNAKGGRLGE
jgi:hypothetical protein